MKKDIIDNLSHLFLRKSMVRETNHTLITLIPKINGEKEIDQFKPILCTNNIYKIHTKFLANRLGKITPYLLS